MKNTAIQNFLKMNPQVPQYSEKNTNYLLAGVNPVYYLDDGSQEEQIAPLVASVDWLNISPVLLDSYGESNQDITSSIFAGAVISIGQSFHNTTAATLSNIKFYIKKFGSPTGNVHIDIYAATGSFGSTSKPTGALLGSSDSLDISTLTTSLALKNFVFTGLNKVALAANTNYVAVITYNGGDGSNCLIVGLDHSSPTAPGNSCASGDNSTWTTSADDMVYYIYTGTIATLPIEGNIVDMIPSTEGTYSVYAVSDTTKVYGLTTTTITDLGYPTGSSNANSGGRLAIAGNFLFFTFGVGGAVYKMPLASGSWTSFGSIKVASGVHLMEPFLDFIALRDGSASYTNGGLVKKIDVTAFTISVGIDLGAGWGVIQMRNLNNKYLAIAGGRTAAGGTTIGYPQNYIFLWDGISSRYNYSVKVPGKFIDMKVVDSILYVAVKVASGKTCVYYMSGTQLKKLFTTQLGAVNELVYAPVYCSLFDFKNYLGVHLTNVTNLSDSLLVYGKDEIGDLEFIHSSGRRFDQITVGYDGNIFANLYDPSGVSSIYYLPASGTYQQITYKSQWIPVKNLQAIDIYHDTIPVSGTDAIKITIDGQGEDIIAGSQTITLDDITPTNYLTIKRTRLDVKGFTGNQLKITLSTINSTWRPIIRAIVPISK